MSLKLDQSIDAALKLVNEHSGHQYFDVLVTSLAQLIDADYVLIGELDLVSHQANTVSLWCEGQLGDKLSYDLEGTPCDKVYSGGICVYPRDIATLFPGDKMLDDFGLEGYVGKSLKSAEGQPIGLLIAMFKQKDQASDDILGIFDLFAIRASAELERSLWERELQKQISLLQKKNQQLDLSHRVFEHTNEGLLVSDENNNILEVNTAFERTCGYSREELIGNNPSMLSSGLQPKSFYNGMWQDLYTKGIWQGELWNRRKNGETYPVWSSITLVKNDQGGISNFISSFRDISSEKELQEQLYHQATHDYLTGLSNSFEFHDHANKAIAVAKRASQHIALIRMNIDNLNMVNSSYGHIVGDMVVKTIGEKLKGQTRDSDLLARLGGDDFALLAGYDSFHRLEKQIKRTLQLFTENIHTELGDISPSCSVGISILGEDADDLESLMRNAHKALRFAKQHYRGGYSFYSQEFEEQARRHDRVENRLYKAISEGMIEPYFQPIINLKDMSVHHCEALARWTDEQLGQVSPAEFIPIAESTGLIQKLGELIFNRSVQIFAQLNSELSREQKNPVGVTVNRSPGEFNFSKGERASTGDIVTKYDLSPDLVCIEITESLMIESPDEALEQLNHIKNQGFSLALDDFGTGFSSLGYLKHYPFDYLKIDQSFVRDMKEQGEDYILVKTIIQMAKNLGLKTIAEGVETEEQRQLLKDLGCDYGQGYLFSKPLPEEELFQFVRNA
ncbi:EAL domain-containing protein [Neptuniibacter sp. QD37_6]|uniref:bifunctional diguanylate cyclase/phosphodiesterase n=1 Tax=Neptuniibacter sp. QD37_6 TaxID=3398210 RepID=UPI0039F6046A